MLITAPTMTADSPSKLTALLAAANAGSEAAADELYRVVYDELREIASRQAAKSPPTESLRPTALVHEAYMRIAHKSGPDITSTSHFYFVVSRAMRDIVVEHARRRRALRRGGSWTRIQLGEDAGAATDAAVDALDLHHALEELRRVDPGVEAVISLRCFGGLTMRQTAEATGTSLAIVRRDWAYGLAWLHARLVDGEAAEGGAGA